MSQQPQVFKCHPRSEHDVQAVLLTHGNMDAVAAWCGGSIVIANDQVELDLPDERDPSYLNRARVGEYVLRGCTGRYWSLGPALFEREYEVRS